MNILNTLRKPYFAIFFSSLLLFISCSDTSSNINEERKFNYTTFKAFKGLEYKVSISEKVLLTHNSIEKYEKINQQINEELGSDIYFNDLDNSYLTNVITKSNVESFSNEYLNQTDLDLIQNLKGDIVNLGFDDAIKKFENNVMTLNLIETEFNKYNTFANVLKLLKEQEPNIFDNINQNYVTRVSSNCGDAILSYSLATLALAACGASGPAAPLLCGIAIANKIRTFRNMIQACGDN